jgi:hypothetical protein
MLLRVTNLRLGIDEPDAALPERLGRVLGHRTFLPPYSAASALARNLLLLPVILGHGFRRLLPL